MKKIIFSFLAVLLCTFFIAPAFANKDNNMDKNLMCKKIKASYLFVGDDWYETEKWKNYENELSKIGVKVIYFPYTDGISSTMLRKELKNEKD